MNSNGDTLRLAVLIDGENVSANVADALFAQVNKIGNPIIRRVYGDFQNGRMKDWVSAIEKHALMAMHVQPTGGKNGADMALAIDAMDLLYNNRPDIFCIVTSDRDFGRLIIRLREAGCIVHGFGEQKAPASLAAACNQFHRLKGITPSLNAAKLISGAPAVCKPPAKPAAPAPVATAAKPAPPQPAVERKPYLAWPWIETALPPDLTAWMTLSALGQALRAQHPDYLKNTGYASLKGILNALNDRFEQGVATDGKTAQVRRRP